MGQQALAHIERYSYTEATSGLRQALEHVLR